MTLIRKSSFGRMFYILALGLSMVPGRAAAQMNAPNMEGNFTLSSPVLWESTVLQPGSYWISLDSLSSSSPFSIVKISNGKRMVAAFIGLAHSDDGTSMKNVLTVERTGRTAVVRSLELPEFGAVFYYRAPKSAPLVARDPTTSASASTSPPGN